MASWSENSSYQGAASGTATGAMVGGAPGAVIGGAVGFVAGGLIGGSQEDSAKKAEEERQKEIQRAIERQNTADFNAKAQAEQWDIADIGINKEDQVMDARNNTANLINNAGKANDAVAAQLGARSFNGNNGITEENWDQKKSMYSSANHKYINATDIAIQNARTARGALASNEGIIASYENDMGAPKKY